MEAILDMENSWIWVLGAGEQTGFASELCQTARYYSNTGEKRISEERIKYAESNRSELGRFCVNLLQERKGDIDNL